MEVNDFIQNFANQFDDTELSEFKADTRFRDLEEWSSLTALAVLNMIGKKYGVILKLDDMRNAQTVQDLFDLVQSKK